VQLLREVHYIIQALRIQSVKIEIIIIFLYADIHRAFHVLMRCIHMVVQSDGGKFDLIDARQCRSMELHRVNPCRLLHTLQAQTRRPEPEP